METGNMIKRLTGGNLNSIIPNHSLKRPDHARQWAVMSLSGGQTNRHYSISKSALPAGESDFGLDRE